MCRVYYLCEYMEYMSVCCFGLPVEGAAPANQGSGAAGLRSKWELVDYADDSSEEEAVK